MNANERKSLVRGAAIQVAASLAHTFAPENYKRLASEAVRVAIHVVAELEKTEGLAEETGALDKLKASVAANVEPVPQADGQP